MSTFNMKKVREELMVFLRNSDILSTTQRGVTTATDSFTATLSQTLFTLTNYTVRNIRSVTVNAVAKSVYQDYTPTYNTGSASTVTLGTASALSDAVSIQYDYSSGTTEKVWPDYPEIIFLPTSCPRIGFDFISMRTKPIGCGSVGWITDALVRIKFYDLGTYLTIDDFITTFRAAVKAAEKNFYHFQIAWIGDMGPVNPVIENVGTKKVFERYNDMTLSLAFES